MRYQQPPHVPTELDRKRVMELSGYGVLQPQIADIIGCSVATLLRHYRKEIDEGRARAHAAVGKSLFTMATTGKNVQAAIWFSRAQMGWRDPARLPEEQPQQTTLKVEFRWADDTPTALNSPGASPRGRARAAPTLEGKAIAFRDDDETSR